MVPPWRQLVMSLIQSNSRQNPSIRIAVKHWTGAYQEFAFVPEVTRSKTLAALAARIG